LATVLTPNIPEAELLCGIRIVDAADAEAAIDALRQFGAHAVLLKGGHLDEGLQVVDRYRDTTDRVEFAHERLSLEAHGTGCTLASAIAANLCHGLAMRNAVERAIGYVETALRRGYRPGRGDLVVLDHLGAALRAD
jgi:hydroxymethylpyrimidine/phosphomethylpyrimidine kinase